LTSKAGDFCSTAKASVARLLLRDGGDVGEPLGGDGTCCEPVLRQHAHFAPSADASTALVNLEAVPLSAGLARAFVRHAFAALDQDSEDVALLLTSELVTNAVLHARTPLQVGLVLDHDRMLVCVSDRVDDGLTLTALAKSGDRHGGRGLALVEELAEAWGTTRYSGGKTVWFMMRTTPDPERRAS
jgi:anti-sigma regulatory factor (Ser/Thr protein kinase)